ncbi:GRIM-19 [Auriculariales sp. MPI-PUGE-AT-0066]|nr:GRIM-19 [Auriculariales sp. MPI-PUGE-AT-0066]
MALPYRQDMPPSGGFEMIKYRRNLPTRGFGAYTILGAVSGIMLWGFWTVARARVEKVELEREKMWARIYLVPLLTAESDRDTFRRQHAVREREAAIMKNVPGWDKNYRGPTKPSEGRIGLQI